MSENSIEFSLSNSEQRDSWLNSGHWTLDADSTSQTLDPYFSRLYYKATASQRIQQHLGSIQQNDENGTLCANHRKDFGRRSGEIIPG